MFACMCQATAVRASSLLISTTGRVRVLIQVQVLATTQSVDSTVLSFFLESSAQHRGMRLNLIAMKNEKSQSQNLHQGRQSAQTGKPASIAQCKPRRHYPKRVLN